MVGLLALVVGMIAALPTKCNPPMQWYQGGVLYEIFPGSFFDKNMDSVGDFNGIATKVDYLAELGVKGVRLNSIFESHEYPEEYRNFSSFKKIAPQLGTLEEFKRMCSQLKNKSISVLLDLHLKPVLKRLPGGDSSEDLVGDALKYWLSNGVEGFYLKDLEAFVSDPHLPTAIRAWKAVLGPDRPLIINITALNMAPANFKNTLLNHVDLIDCKLDIESGATGKWGIIGPKHTPVITFAAFTQPETFLLYRHQPADRVPLQQHPLPQTGDALDPLEPRQRGHSPPGRPLAPDERHPRSHPPPADAARNPLNLLR